MGTPIGTPIGTPNFKFDGTPMGRAIGSLPGFLSPNGRIYCGPFQQEEFFDDDQKQVRNRLQLGFQLVQAIRHQFWKDWIKLSISPILLQDWHTKMRVTYQDKSAFNSKSKMVKFVEVYPEKSGNEMVQPNQEESGKNKLSQGYELQRDVSNLPMLLELQENEDDEDNEVEIDMMNDDVYKPLMLVKVEDEGNVNSFVKNYVKNKEDNDGEVIDAI